MDSKIIKENVNRRLMLRIFTCCLITLSAPLAAEKNIAKDSSFRIVHTAEEMLRHKEQCKRQMVSDPSKTRDPFYQMSRALLTISGDDVDSIPKVEKAGEIFYDQELGPYQLMHNGSKVVLNGYYDSQWLTDVIYGLKGHHEPQEEKCFHEILQYMPENATMIELGSYWAYYSLWFASAVKGARNYLIEPDPKRLEVGKKNFQLNNKTGVFRRGFVGVLKDADPDVTGTECIAIDDFIEQEKIGHIDILHADIQGGESGMLASSVRHLEDIDYFVISTHDPESDHYPCLHFLQAHGFIILAEHTNGESCSGDGLIVARRSGVEGCGPISIRKY
jgi:hypothetical protein